MEPHCHHSALNYPIISKFMHTFFLQCPPSHKQFDPMDVKQVLFFFESWAPASSLLILNWLGKTATLLALVTTRFCSDLTLLHVDNQDPFLQYNTAIFVSASGGKIDWQGHLLP